MAGHYNHLIVACICVVAGTVFKIRSRPYTLLGIVYPRNEKEGVGLRLCL